MTQHGVGVERLIADLEQRARAHLPDATYAYVAGGSGAEITLDEATGAWRWHRFRPRVLRDVARVDTRTTVLGTYLPSPIGLAPVGYQGLLHEDGERATAAGADDHLLVVSARADRPLAEIAHASRTWWYQTYVTADRMVGDGLVETAAGAGARAIVLTGDTPYVAAKARTGRLRGLAPEAEQVPATLADIGRLQSLSGLPVLVKGVLRADDAKAVLDAGAAGIVVSTHGGRQLDRAVPSAYALAEVVVAADGVPVLVDGGLRSGHDVLTALALGADAVLVGRPVMWASAVEGAEGVRRLLTSWDAELAHVLGLAGCRTPADVGADLLAR